MKKIVRQKKLADKKVQGYTENNPTLASKHAKAINQEGGYWGLVDELNPGMVMFQPNRAYLKAALRRDKKRGRAKDA